MCAGSLCFLVGGCTGDSGGDGVYSRGHDTDYATSESTVIQLDMPAADEDIGGVIAADVNDDGHMDFVVTKRNRIAVHDHSGIKLWSKPAGIQVTNKSERHGLPGTQAPGIQAADIDGDQKTEILYLTTDGFLTIAQGDSGVIRKSVELDTPPGADRWEHLVVANFRGTGDRDLLLQATNADGYRMGRYLAAYAIEDLMEDETPAPLWQRDDFIASAHNGARIADLDGDGRDEVLGGALVGPDGEMLFALSLEGHVDSLFVDDVRPDIPGLEVVALEESPRRRLFSNKNRFGRFGNRIWKVPNLSGNRIFLYNHDGLIWQTDYEHQEPQNAAVGDFDPSRPGLEVWCRSRYDTHQQPFVFDARGQLIASYEMRDVAPRGWTAKGVEVISTITWTGEGRQFAAAKERHTSGDVAVFDPMTGRFLVRFDDQADRLYVADVVNDWREEIIVLHGNELHIYQNDKSNPNPGRTALWTNDHYRRSKMTWNYYSP
jgi:hypothetical protein